MAEFFLIGEFGGVLERCASALEQDGRAVRAFAGREEAFLAGLDARPAGVALRVNAGRFGARDEVEEVRGRFPGVPLVLLLDVPACARIAPDAFESWVDRAFVLPVGSDRVAAEFLALVSAAEKKRGGQPRCVMAVDADATCRRMLRKMLIFAGYAVCACESLEEAAADPFLLHADVLVADAPLPPRRGAEAFRAVRTHNPRIRILALSAVGDTSPEACGRLARDLGADLDLPKPFDMDAMIGTVAGLAAEAAGER